MNAKDIKELRKKLNLSQDEFAKLIGVSKNTVYNYENGAKIPDSKITILRNINNKNDNYVSEPSATYNTGRHKIIADYRADIEKIEEKINKWEEKLKAYPSKKQKYEGIIQGYEDQIIQLNKIINTLLVANEDFNDYKHE